MRTDQRLDSLLVAFHRIGDLTLSTPLLRALARGRALALLTRPYGAPLLQGQSYLQRVWTLPYPNRGRSGLARLLLGGHRRALGRRLAAAGYHEVLVYETERPLIREWLEGLFPGLVQPIARRAPAGTHVGEITRRGAAGLGCDAEGYDPLPLLEVPAAAAERAARRLSAISGRIVGLQMGSHAPPVIRPRPNLKTLAPEQWRAWASRLLREGHADALALHGSGSERRLIRAFLNSMPAPLRARCHDLTDVGLDLLPAVLARHQALISVDTGTAHIAAAVGCPLLALFGPTDPAEFAPRGRAPVQLLVGSAPCQFCHRTPLYKSCRDNVCLNRLSPESLWEAWLRLRYDL